MLGNRREVRVQYLMVPPAAYLLTTLLTIPISLPIILPILPAISSTVLPTIRLPVSDCQLKVMYDQISLVPIYKLKLPRKTTIQSFIKTIS